MGNNQNCCVSTNFYDVENAQEIYIREQIQKNISRIKSFEEISKISNEVFQTALIDIDSSPLEWITENSYHNFCSLIFSSKETLWVLNYNDVNVSSRAYKESFNLLLLMWLIMNIGRKMNLKTKISEMKEIIIKVSRILTYSTFSLFIKTLLELILLDSTMNIKVINESDYHKLLMNVFNINNVNEFHSFLIGRMKKIIMKEKPTLTDEFNFDNEYITDEYLNKFFNDNSYLADALELRVNFYSKYSLTNHYSNFN